MPNNNIKISPPWYQLQKELKIFFMDDPFISIGDLTGDGELEMGILIQCQLLDQAAVYKKMLKTKHVFGNITVNITILGPDENKEVETSADMTEAEMMDLMFKYNPRYLGYALREMFGRTFTYCVFTKDLIQFPNDDLSSYELYTTEIAANVMQKFLVETTVICCTVVDGATGNENLQKGK